MPRLAYVNGRYVPHAQAAVHIEDRGYQFADGVYEVVPVYRGILVDEEPHLDRLDRSLSELRIAWPMSREALRLILGELIRRNGLTNGLVYLQMTRGTAPRDHKFPAASETALVITTKRQNPISEAVLAEGVSVITIPDIRWRRCDIKSISLLPNVLGKQQAVEAGAYEAWQVDDDGYVTEGTSTNAWIVSAEGQLVTRGVEHAILNGITRRSLLDLVREAGIALEERRFTVAEAKAAREAFLTSSSSFVLPITRIDDSPVGSGKPGALTKRLREHYVSHITHAERKKALA
ncbi:D-amino-acid transaminase [Rhodospirillaceae bacterium SYSU D60014]|uniref:D-amino-acid transaminase n=1 Tax=Virgifigura deserti TaxID=2268457 RepID=UPI000E6765E6